MFRRAHNSCVRQFNEQDLNMALAGLLEYPGNNQPFTHTDIERDREIQKETEREIQKEIEKDIQ